MPATHRYGNAIALREEVPTFNRFVKCQDRCNIVQVTNFGYHFIMFAVGIIVFYLIYFSVTRDKTCETAGTPLNETAPSQPPVIDFLFGLIKYSVPTVMFCFLVLTSCVMYWIPKSLITYQSRGTQTNNYESAFQQSKCTNGTNLYLLQERGRNDNTNVRDLCGIVTIKS